MPVTAFMFLILITAYKYRAALLPTHHFSLSLAPEEKVELLMTSPISSRQKLKLLMVHMYENFTTLIWQRKIDPMSTKMTMLLSRSTRHSSERSSYLCVTPALGHRPAGHFRRGRGTRDSWHCQRDRRCWGARGWGGEICHFHSSVFSPDVHLHPYTPDGSSLPPRNKQCECD